MPHLHTLLARLSLVLVPLSVALTVYLYLYPVWHRGCAFSTPPVRVQSASLFGECDFGGDGVLKAYYKRRDVAPFRLLALGDPQLEGDSSLPEPVERVFPGFGALREKVLKGDAESVVNMLKAGVEDYWKETGRIMSYTRKQLDLLGNDFYLAHIYRTMHWWTDPTHVSVLGDLLGSQWIGDEEFERRAGRFWGRVFRGGQVVDGNVMRDYKGEVKEGVTQVLGEEDWKRRIINVAGNHDIGYAGDIETNRVVRFEREFGNVNGDVRFTLPILQCGGNTSSDEAQPTLRIVVLNSMNIDSPAYDTVLQQDTYTFINDVITNSDAVGTHTTSTILLTHIPLHKESGTCVDSPLFSFFSAEESGGVKEQNMISKDMSANAVLEAIFGMTTDTENGAASGVGRDGIILTGHDHEGCDVYHYADTSRKAWTAARWADADAAEAHEDASIPGIREVTLRSMMGEFGGYAYLVSAWWDDEFAKWTIEVSSCGLGVQHVWWAVHILDLATVIVSLLALITRGLRRSEPAAVQTEVVDVHSEKAKSRGSKVSPPKAKESAFTRRMQQSLEEDRIVLDTEKSRPTKKQEGKRKPEIKLKREKQVG